jgi:tetratricopeptide (TPR) repeat protein
VLVLDDVRAIERNSTIRTLSPLSVPLSPPGASTVAGRPIANLSFAINYAFADPDLRSTRAFHVGNVAIHFAAALCLFAVVARTLRSPRLAGRFGQGAPYLAGTIALLWSVHPLQTESVTYLVQRVESLMGLFYLLTLYCAIRAVEDRRSTIWTFATVVFAALGMATKEVFVTAPVAVAAWYVLFGSAATRRLQRQVVLGLAATWLVFAALVVHEHRAPSLDLQFSTSWRYLLTQSSVIVHYLRLSLWPAPLVFLYTWPLATSIWQVLVPALIIVALLGATVVGFIRGAPISYAGVWFFIILAPTSSVIPIATEVAAEHRMYLPLAAVISAIVIGIYVVLEKWLARRQILMQLVAAALIALLAIPLAAETRARNRDYWSEEALWRDTVEKQPGNERARVAYGTALAAVGKLAEAETQLRRAVELDEGDPLAHTRLGTVLAAQDKSTEAVAELERALDLRGDDVDAHRALGQIYALRHDDRRAVTHLSRAVELAGDSPPLLTNLAAILADSRDVTVRDAPRALVLAERAVALTGRQDAFALDVLAVAQAGTGRFGEASATAREGAAIARAQGNESLLNELEYRANAYAGLAR